MFNRMEDKVRDMLINALEDYTTCHLLNASELADTLVDEILSTKPWWWLINFYHVYEENFHEVEREYNVPTFRDTTEVARDVIKLQAADLLELCDTVIDHWRVYDSIEEHPAMLNRLVASHIAMDLCEV